MSGAVLANPSPGPSANGLFTDLPPRPSGLLRPRWWLLALALHLLILGLPASLWPPDPEVGPPLSVEVRLERPLPLTTPTPPPEPIPRPEPARPPEPSRTAEAPVRQPAADAPTRTADVQPADATAPADPAAQPTVRVETPSLRVERLLESVAAMDWAAPAATRSISRPVTSTTAEAWARPLLPPGTNALDGTFAPDEVEIVDRWQSPGGVHEVVIRAPDGDTYCGRQEPMDVFRPWTQMPMLFHRCAGGGKRHGGASWRNN